MQTTKAQLIEHFRYLDNLRESGVTNMFGAASYVEEAFGVDKKEAKAILLKWMNTFNEDQTPTERVEAILNHQDTQK